MNELVVIYKSFNFITFALDRTKKIYGKGKSITLSITKRSWTSKDISNTITNDEDSNLDEEEMVLLSKKFTTLFHNKKTSLGGVRRDSLSTKGLKSMKNNEDSKNE